MMLALQNATKLLTLCLWLLLTACGGGGSDSPQPQPDTTPPVITLNGDSAISLFLNETYEELGASAADNIDGTVSVAISGTVDTSTLGDYSITYSANDSAGNASSVTRTITVLQPDITPPVITLNGVSFVPLFIDETYEELGASATDNIDGVVSVTISGTVDTNTLGDYTLTYSATDSAGNTSSVSRIISVVERRDNQLPIITLNGDNPLNVYLNDTYLELGASAIDKYGLSVEVEISGTVDTSTLGYYFVYYKAFNTDSNHGSSETRIVQVVPSLDRIPPVITLNGNTTINVVVGDSYDELGATAFDEVDGNVEVTISGFVDTTIIGTYYLIYTATDSDGNSASAERTVVVVSSLTNRPFITKWKTNNHGVSHANQITIQTLGTGYDYIVNWGDGTTDEHVTGDITHTYQESGIYFVTINGNFPQIYFTKGNLPDFDEYNSDSQKLLSIEQWGDIKWQSMHMAFYACSYLEGNASDTPDLTEVTDMSYMFYEAELYNQNLNNWDVSSVTNMEYLFYRTYAFNQDLSSWDVSSVTNMSGMFSGTKVFNQELSSWDVSSVTDMRTMFANTEAFNQDLSSWDVSSVTIMSGVFSFTNAFNQDLSSWDVSSVVTMRSMFRATTAFNQDLSSWDVSSVTNMSRMFSGRVGRTDLFNQDLSSWDVSSVINMEEMFRGSKSFNQDLSSWDVSSVTNMTWMFHQAINFNQDLSRWDVSSVTDMSWIFKETSLSTANYDSMLIGWSSLPLQQSVFFGVGNTKYSSSAATARDVLTNTYGWTIIDGGVAN